MLKEYNFVLHYKIPLDEDPETYIDPLFEEGCDDSTLYFGKPGYIEIDFIREANTAADAIASAIKQVKSAIPNSEICHVLSEN